MTGLIVENDMMVLTILENGKERDITARDIKAISVEFHNRVLVKVMSVGGLVEALVVNIKTKLDKIK